MKIPEKKYWRIRAALEEFLHISEEQVAQNKDVQDFLDIMAKKVLAAGKDKQLEEMGIAILRPKPKRV
jgi:hypothetical protein